MELPSNEQFEFKTLNDSMHVSALPSNLEVVLVVSAPLMAGNLPLYPVFRLEGLKLKLIRKLLVPSFNLLKLRGLTPSPRDHLLK